MLSLEDCSSRGGLSKLQALFGSPSSMLTFSSGDKCTSLGVALIHLLIGDIEVCWKIIVVFILISFCLKTSIT
ncbi:hypothetical protein M6B38_145340 [Iris pallida]|uniref:Uncharacterized protein n=1 Tax=Iris pallida TaxID=29817 RepID=A0AAX6F9U6_IRIPA|nr:hypothetical protein M6B38_145340 [Iris pallida]